MDGKLIVIEGTDGSGKATQAKLLAERISAAGRRTTLVSYPRYGHFMARPVEVYLEGRYGKDPESVNPWTASLFYAIDRFDSFRTEWQELYLSGGIIVADRYTTSNALHQAEKLPPNRRHAFLDWLYDLEYVKLGIPKPDLTVYLDVDADVAYAMAHTRSGKPGVKGDIHENDRDYLRRVKESAYDTIRYSGWTRIACTENGAFLPPETICDAIMTIAAPLINNT